MRFYIYVRGDVLLSITVALLIIILLIKTCNNSNNDYTNYDAETDEILTKEVKWKKKQHLL